MSTRERTGGSAGRRLATAVVVALLVGDAVLIALALHGPTGTAAAESQAATSSLMSTPSAAPSSADAADTPTASPTGSTAATGTTGPAQPAARLRPLLDVVDATTLVRADAPSASDVAAGRCSATPALSVSDDGGASWRPLGTPSGSLAAVGFSAADAGTAVGFAPRCRLVVASTASGGTRWKTADTSAAALPDKPLDVAVAAGTVWVLGPSSLTVLDTTGTPTAHDVPCASGFPAQSVVALGEQRGVVICAKPGEGGHQARLVYHTTDGGATWSKPSGATSADGTGGRKDGLDADGELVAVGRLGTSRVGVLLAGGGCDGLAVRVSDDTGFTWRQAGCLPAATAGAEAAALSGADSTLWALVAHGGVETAYTSTDGGATWSSKG